MPVDNKRNVWTALVRLLCTAVLFSPVMGLPARMAKAVMQHMSIKLDRGLSWILGYCLLSGMVPIAYLLENMIFMRVTRKNVSLWTCLNECAQDFVDAFEAWRGR